MELLFPGSDHDNSYGKMDAFTRLFYDHVFRERRLQQLQHRYLLQEENEFGVIRREKDERDPLVIPKSRDGLSYLSGFQTFQMQNMKTEPRVKQKPRDKLERQIINQFSTAAEIKDHSGKFYFSLLDQNWDSISREHMLSLEAVVKDPPPLLRHYDEACKSFTIIYSDPYKLDLRCRSLQYAQTRVFNSSTLERLKTSSDRLAYEERFKNFLKCHDNNINQLQILSSGYESQPTDCNKFIRKLHLVKFVPREFKIPKAATESSTSFRWDSQIFVGKPDLQDFISSHNKNVIAFQALLDDPIKSTTSRNPVLDPKIYSKILDTDLFLKKSQRLVFDIGNLVVDMMGACRENYIKDKLFPLLRNEIAAPPLGHRLIILPEYANSNPSNVIEYACKKAKVQRRNEWILTDAGGNMVSGGEFTPIRLGSTRFSSFGVLKCDEAIVYAFLNLSEQLNHIIFHPSDRCIVHVNREENIVVVECTRWKDFKIVKTIPLPQSLRLQPLDTDEQQHLYFRCQSTSSCSDAILMEANDTIVRRWIWRDSPWKKANYDDISDLDSHTKMLHPSALEEERFSRTVRALRSHIAPYFQRSFCLDIRKLVWYPESCQQFLSKYEAAAHHLHYNRLEDFMKLLSSDKDLVRQVHLCQSGETLLEIAIAEDNLEATKFLIQCGCDFNRLNSRGDTPLYFALRHMKEEIALFLISIGAQLTCNQAQMSPLLLACEWAKVSIILDLVRSGASWESQDKWGRTPLTVLAKNFKEIFPEPNLLPPLLKSRGFLDTDVSALTHASQNPKYQASLKNYLGIFFPRSSPRYSLSELKKLDIGCPLNEPILNHIGSLLLHENVEELVLTCVHDDDLCRLTHFIGLQDKLEHLSLFQIPELRSLPVKVDYTALGIAYLAHVIKIGCGLVSLSLQCDEKGVLSFLGCLRGPSSLQFLTIDIFGLVENSTISNFFNHLCLSHSLTRLWLRGEDLTLQQWELIFSSLQSSLHITELSVYFTIHTCDQLSFIISLLADYLTHNTVLKRLSIRGLQDGSLAIADAIAHNIHSNLEDLQGISLNTPEARGILKLDKYFRRKKNAVILKYLREMRQGAVVVRRMKLIFAGNGEVGKSTLIRRLKEGKFEENSHIMTDGIDISYFTIDGVEMSVFDFAGQPEYEHTHSLFFDHNSIYLLLYSPRAGGMDRLKIYQQMILNSVPNATIIFVTTRADEARLSQDEINHIREGCPNIIHYVAVDSKSGTGIAELEKLLVVTALQKENTVRSVPTSFEKFRQQLQYLGTTQFSLSYEEIKVLCITKLSIKPDLVDLALSLFLSWGYIFRLSNGDYVLQPQQLADVMACVFTKLETTKSRIGDVREGVLRHTNEVLDAVWTHKFPSLQKSMWRCPTDGSDSPFLSLLYQAGLAFPLFDSQSKPIGASLVPGLLPLQPCGFHTLSDSRIPYHEKLCQLFVPSSMTSKVHPRVTIHFQDVLPTALMGRLQVKLRRMATLGGAWKKGCCLVLHEVERDKPIDHSKQKTTDQANIVSLTIIHQVKNDTALEFISAGVDTSARSTVLSIMMTLMEQQFPCICIESVILNTDIREYGPHDLLENFPSGYIYHATEKISIGSLRILEPALRDRLNVGRLKTLEPSRRKLFLHPAESVTESEILSAEPVFDHLSLSFLVESNPYLSLCHQQTIKRLQDLEIMVSTLEKSNIESEDNGDLVFLSDKFLSCIPCILHIMGLRHSRRGVSTMWILLGSKSGQTIAVPLTPTRVQGNVQWYPLLDEAKIELDDTHSESSNSQENEWLAKAAASVIERVLVILEVPIPKHWVMKPYKKVSNLINTFKQLEMRYFLELDGIMLMERYYQSAQGMLMSRQIKRVDERSQAQERLLMKVVQRTDETFEILRRVEIVVTGIADGMKVHFSEIQKQLSMTNPDGLLELKDLWIKKVNDLEKAIEKGGENCTNCIENHMRKLDVMLSATLFDLDVDVDDIKSELQVIKTHLLEANESRLRGESTAEKKLNLILSDMKLLQTQLDRVENLAQKVFHSLVNGLAEIRQELLQNSNSDGLYELRDLWLRKMNDLEKTLTSNYSPEAFDKQIQKIECLMNAKLVDLDLSVSSNLLSSQFQDMKQQLQDVMVIVNRGDENSQRLLMEMISGLKGLQTELVEIIRLEHENANHLNEGLTMLKNCIVNINSRICPTTFILLPILKNNNEIERKGLVKHLHQIHQALKSPRRALLNLLQEKYYIVLICESCRQHPENKELWYLIEKPKDIVGKILPLARAGLQFASAVNTISSLGRIFGLPTPVLSDSTFQEGSEFLDELENGSLSDYSELERVAEENNSQGMPSTGGISSGGMGYCIREFSAFLTKLDPNKRWGHLSPRVNERGDLCFICPTCVSNSSVVGGR